MELKKMKPIPMSLKDKKRYLCLEFEFDAEVDSSKIKKAVWDRLSKFIGEFGIATGKLHVFDFDGKCIYVRCINDYLPRVKLGLAAIDKVDGVAVIPKIKLVSGSLKALEKKLGIKEE